MPEVTSQYMYLRDVANWVTICQTVPAACAINVSELSNAPLGAK